MNFTQSCLYEPWCTKISWTDPIISCRASTPKSGDKVDSTSNTLGDKTQVEENTVVQLGLYWSRPGPILSWRLIMKYFLRSFFSFLWFKMGCHQSQVKVYGQSTVWHKFAHEKSVVRLIWPSRHWRLNHKQKKTTTEKTLGSCKFCVSLKIVNF